MITHLLKIGKMFTVGVVQVSHVPAVSPKVVHSDTFTSRADGWSVLLYHLSQHPVNSLCIPSYVIDIPFRLIRRSPGQKTVVTRSILLIFVKHKLDASNQQCPTTANPSSTF